jgi:NAD(P)H dehydrogenase (quinone)
MPAQYATRILGEPVRISLSVLAALAFLHGDGHAQCEPTVLIAYHSHTGHTRAMAEAVAAGVAGAGGTALLRSVDSVPAAELVAADAIVLGSPVHNANMAAPMQEFISRWPFEGRPLADKPGAVFVAGGGMSAGQEATQLALIRAMLVHGLIIVGGVDWLSAFGAAAITDEEPFAAGVRPVDERFLVKARGLGARVVDVAPWSCCGTG